MSTEESLPPLPPGRPYRLGTSSYIYPADILPNAERLAPVVEDIELILFESDDVSNLPGPEVIERLAELGRQHDCSYTVHFPIDKKLGSPVAAERLALVEQIRKIMVLTRPLLPHGYLLHFEGIADTADAAEVRRWQHDLHEAIKRILDGGCDPRFFCIENLNFPFEWCVPLIDTYGFSVCLDVGHLWRYGVPPEAHLRRYLPRTRVVHLHGERAGHDHISLRELDSGRMDFIMRALQNYSGVVTLELFNYDTARTSIERMTEWLADQKKQKSV